MATLTVCSLLVPSPLCWMRRVLMTWRKVYHLHQSWDLPVVTHLTQVFQKRYLQTLNIIFVVKRLCHWRLKCCWQHERHGIFSQCGYWLSLSNFRVKTQSRRTLFERLVFPPSLINKYLGQCQNCLNNSGRTWEKDFILNRLQSTQ